MNTRTFCTVPLIAAAIMVLAAGCGIAASTPAPSALEEPDITVAAIPAVDLVGLYIAQYGEQILVDLDQGATLNFPIDGYVATRAWAQKYPKTAAAFVRAIEEGQTIANSDAAAVRTAVARYDKLPPQVTAAMVLSGYPIGPVNETHIQRVALAMLQFGMLGKQYATEVERGNLVESMVDPS